MRVATWNTFLAPLMPRRAARLPRVLQTLSDLIENEKIDVLALQELHGYMRGPIGTWLAGAWDGVPARLERWLGPGAAHALQIISELLAMAEGWLWPRAYHAPYRSAVVAHCVARGLAYATPVASPRPAPGDVTAGPGLGDHGVVILSRWPLTQVVSYHLPTDMIHRPGAVCATTCNEETGDVLRVWSAHLLPQLPDAKATYRAVHAINRLAGVRVPQQARANLQQLRQWLDADADASTDKKRATVLAMGDFNTDVAAVRDALPPGMALYSPDQNTICTHEVEAPVCLDHIWVWSRGDGAATPRAAAVHARAADTARPLWESTGSDHYPVWAELSGS